MDSTTRQILDLSRRGLLRGATAAAALAAITPASFRHAVAQPVFRAYPFTMGVASGEPLPDGVVIWTRLAPEPLAGGGMPRIAVEVTWEVATDRQMRNIAARGTALARPELGHAVHVEVEGLQPARTYFYRFRAGREASPVGRTRTAPAAEAMPDRLRFVSAGCQHWEVGYYTAWRHIAETENLDFVAHYGDYIYEYRARGGAPGSAVAVRQHNSEEIYTIDDYRNRYALYRSDADLQAAHAAHPFLMSFDDHEVDNNWAGAISEEDGGARFPVAVPPEIFALRKQIAFQAWWEAMPLRRAQLPRGPEMTAWRALRWGRLADIAVLDTRSHRDDQPCGDINGAPCEAVRNPQAQVLGAVQEAWLMDRLAATSATWKVLAQQVPMMQRDFGGNAPFISMDKWDAYPAARERLFRHIHERQVKNVAVLTGDVHQAWAATLRLDFADENSPVVGTEFVATSISSNGDGTETLGQTERVLARNPHIGFFNNRRGYSLHEANAERLEARFIGLDYVTRPGAPAVEKGRFVVEAGGGALLRA
ncbi:alkaline phosphatase D family protein [Falsiroseomonas selenitidurans]|uniref:Alkaline phosphatase n=1 Tax=Falsiroseomonas selenitidurans TaxID=2716335 RepID=A0ABX1E2A0_9PROT|nr:alkaline phosphatase D family protein [Falsiroseomonas selenitidurans]NKC29892.1 alkaline phosphatase [Falsiroseomonas selenitidurans]